MSSPLTIYVAAFSGLQVEMIEDHFFGRSRNGQELVGFDCPEQHTYLLKDPHDNFHTKDSATSAAEVTGKLSPLNKITVPPATREKLGIHKEATHFAYAHPPEELAEDIDWSKYDFTTDFSERADNFFDNPTCTIDRGERIKNFNYTGMFPVLGGYVYFDKNGNVVSVNVLTLARTKYKIFLTGSYETPSAVVDAMSESRRIRVLPFEQFHESSFVAMGWIRPSEKLAGEPLLEKREHLHGAFIMVRYDNTAVTYTVERKEFTDYEGDTSVIPDVYDSFYGSSQFSPTFITSNFIDSSEIRKLRTSINAIVMKIQRDSPSIPSLMEGKTSLIHKAAHSGVSLKYIQKLLDDPRAIKCMRRKDDCGWTPLHYACAFDPTNFDMIRKFIDKCPDSVVARDNFHRSPLHIACDACAPVSVIEILLEGKGRSLVHQKTKYLGRLPLHIALNRNASVEVISALLEADDSGKSIREETSQGRRPLHIAIAMKASSDLIRLLLDADSSIASGAIDSDADIKHTYRGHLPLHIACLKGCQKEVIRLLLEKDSNLSTLSIPVDERESATTLSRRNLLQPMPTRPTSACVWSNKVALDIAISRQQEDIVRLLLQKELQKEASAIMRHREERYTLHMACRANLSPDIISTLLHLDTEGKEVCRKDELGWKPIHYACDHDNAQTKVVEMLLEAERASRGRELLDNVPSGRRDTRGNEFGGKSALWFACRANAPVEVLDKLMSQEDFNFQGFESHAFRRSLASMIRNHPILQNRLNHRMAKRFTFFVLNLRLIVFLVLITVFYITTENFADGNVPNWCRITIYSGAGILSLSAIAKMSNQTVRKYLVDLSNWFEMINIAFLWVSSIVFENGCVEDGYSCVLDYFILASTCILLLLNILSFLRSTFYPFALFATGFWTIVKVLLPFITVSSLVLVGFTMTYRIRSNLDVQYNGHPACQDDFGECLLFVANSFFGGQDETRGWLDAFFGIMVVVILLNVVIAIVSNAWRDARALAATTFWRSRVNFLIEMSPRHSTITSNPFFRWIDDLKFVPITDQIPWHKEEPYKSVDSQDLHDYPGRHFLPEDVKKIEQARSLESTLFWIRKTGKDNDENIAMTESRVLTAMTKWAIENSIYTLFVILGIPTLGILWPLDVRERIISVGKAETRLMK